MDDLDAFDFRMSYVKRRRKVVTNAGNDDSPTSDGIAHGSCNTAHYHPDPSPPSIRRAALNSASPHPCAHREPLGRARRRPRTIPHPRCQTHRHRSCRYERRMHHHRCYHIHCLVGRRGPCRVQCGVRRAVDRGPGAEHGCRTSPCVDPALPLCVVPPQPHRASLATSSARPTRVEGSSVPARLPLASTARRHHLRWSLDRPDEADTTRAASSGPSQLGNVDHRYAFCIPRPLAPDGEPERHRASNRPGRSRVATASLHAGKTKLNARAARTARDTDPNLLRSANRLACASGSAENR